MVSRRPVAGSVLGRGQRSGWEGGVGRWRRRGEGLALPPYLPVRGENRGLLSGGAGTVTSSPQDPGPNVWQKKNPH